MLAIVWVFMALHLIVINNSPKTEHLPYSDFSRYLKEGRIAKVQVVNDELRGTFTKPLTNGATRFVTVRIPPELADEFAAHKVVFSGEPRNALGSSVLMSLLPFVVLLLIGTVLMRGVMAKGGIGGRGIMAIGKSKAKVYVENTVKTSFEDVAGVEEAKAELQEVVEFLKTPEKFRRLGGKIPKGILLIGPPGTGKTLLARAVAGEVGVPFFSISGSEFVEMFVGVGAARVRDLFLQAKEKAPCIIFVDELDALGKARGTGPSGHEEREQTLNQLLVEMDGFDPRVGIILMAATNRPEILDQALLRAGRFDRQVLVDRPDKGGRLEILRLHARDVPLAKPANLEIIAAMTVGFAGADLANVINEAALLAARRGREEVGVAELQDAVERVVAGLEKKNRVLRPEEKERVAHHEVGHALVSLLFPGGETVRKISLIPRGMSALGYTLRVPTEERFLMTQAELENTIAALLGGRAAEELIFHDLSTGASNDLLKATEIAKNMVKAYGMSEQLGQVSFQEGPQATFLGQNAERGEYSEATARDIDVAVRRILETQYRRTIHLLIAHLTLLQNAAQLLLQKETMSGEELAVMLAHTNGHASQQTPQAAAVWQQTGS